MDVKNGQIDAVALGCCLRAGGTEKVKRDEFLQKFGKRLTIRRIPPDQIS